MADNKFLVPLAIVVAGAMVAGAIYLGGEKTNLPKPASYETEAIELPEVTEKDHIRGPRTAPVVIVEYSDIECPYCKIFHSTMKELLSAYDGKVSWVYRHFPIPQLHPEKAIPEAIATECAAEQGGEAAFWSFLDKTFEATNSNDSLDLTKLPVIAGEVGLNVGEFESCRTSGRYEQLIQDSMRDAEAVAGRLATPYSVLVLKDMLSDQDIIKLNRLVSSNRLFDRDGSPLLKVSPDGRMIAIGGAFSTELMKEIVDIALNND